MTTETTTTTTETEATPAPKAKKASAKKKATPSEKKATKRVAKRVAKKAAKKAAPKAKKSTKPATKGEGKGATILALIQRKGGATAAELQSATGWQAHSVRGFLSTAAKKGLAKVASEKREDGQRVYSA